MNQDTLDWEQRTGETTSSFAGGTWHVTTERTQARKSHLQNAERVPRPFWKLGSWVVSWFRPFPPAKSWTLTIMQKKKKTFKGTNISSGDTGRMLLEVRTFCLCLSHTNSYTRLAFWVIHCHGWCPANSIVASSLCQPLMQWNSRLTSSLPDTGLFLVKTGASDRTQTCLGLPPWKYYLMMVILKGLY